MIKTNEVSERFNIDTPAPDLAPNYNVRPTQRMPVVVKHSPNHLELMEWGLIPYWTKKQRIINIRAETVAQKSAFKIILQHRRCLVPASGFYEWMGEKGQKTPYYFHLKDTELFAFAGLYDIFENPDGKPFGAYAILTTKPNKLVEKVHDRMPVIFSKENEEEWLNPYVTQPNRLLPLLAPYASNKMEAYGVSRAVNSYRSNGPELIKPA